MGIGFLINGLLLGSLAVLLIEFERPKVCGSIYAIFALAIQVAAYANGAVGPLRAFVSLAILAGGGFALFHLLNRVDTLSLPWWTLLIVAILISSLL